MSNFKKMLNNIGKADKPGGAEATKTEQTAVNKAGGLSLLIKAFSWLIAVVSALSIVGAGSVWLYSLFYHASSPVGSVAFKEDIEPALLPAPEGTDGQAVVRVMSNAAEGPRFLMAVIDPQDVLPGDTQRLEVMVEDKAGIAQVTTKTELDGGKVETLKLELIAGDKKRGRWAGEWVVHSTHKTTYRTTFIAENSEGKREKLTIGWTDSPDDCNPPESGDWTIDDINTAQLGATCNQGLPMGPEGGKIIIKQGVTLNLIADPNSDTTLVWNPGQEVRLEQNAQIILTSVGSKKAQLARGYVFVKDQDRDSVADGALDPNDPNAAQRIFISEADYANVNTNPSLNNMEYILVGSNKYTRLSDLGQTANGNTRPKDGDCDAADSISYFITSGYEDKDGDGYTVGWQNNVCVGYENNYLVSTSLGSDCNDYTIGGEDAYPGSAKWGSGITATAWLNGVADDYNCSGSLTKDWFGKRYGTGPYTYGERVAYFKTSSGCFSIGSGTNPYGCGKYKANDAGVLGLYKDSSCTQPSGGYAGAYVGCQ